jgi:hypothetical protein
MVSYIKAVFPLNTDAHVSSYSINIPNSVPSEVCVCVFFFFLKDSSSPFNKLTPASNVKYDTTQQVVRDFISVNITRNSATRNNFWFEAQT